MLEAQDAADADAVLGQLMRTALPADQQVINPDAAAVLEEVSSVLRDFNQTLQQEAKDRKYRFHIKRLLPAHLQTTTLDAELDFISDDDDVAVLFTLESGRTVWVLGNVEEVAVARGAVDKDKAVGLNSGSYLLGLEKDARPVKGTFHSDPKAMFLFRWYQEADKTGKVLRNAFQHKDCKTYYLPLDNGGHAFEWVSNLQVITAVHLQSMLTKNRTYILPAPDKKTIVEAFEKMRES